jgi:excinuclease ABC subunit A
MRRYRETNSSSARLGIEKLLSINTCPACRGTRLSQEILAIKIDGKNIADVCDFSIEDAVNFFANFSISKTEREISRLVVIEIEERLNFLINVGLEYLSLSRSAATLSGGEAQRIRLATQIGSKLTGVLYVLDEPSIGLHQRDNAKLIKTLKGMRDLGNSLIVVEHDDDTMNSAD